MNTQKHLHFLLGLLYAVLAFGAFILLFPALLPFLLGWGLACFLEPAVAFFCQTLHLRRGWSSATVLLSFLVIFSAGGVFLLQRLWFELTALSVKFPVWIQFLQTLSQRLDQLVYRWTLAVSPEFRSTLQAVLTGTVEQLANLLASFTSSLLTWISDGILALPRLALFLFTALLASYFFLAGNPVLIAFFRRKIPAHRLPKLKKTVQQLKSALGGWLKAQGTLIAVTFLLLTAGLLLMKVNTALLLAAGIALLDALPVFGTGTVLLPWSLICILNGKTLRGIALAALYVILWITRSLLEPKLISKRAGLHPLISLFAMYLGFSLFGVIGIILAPLAAVFAAQLYDAGVLNFRQT